MLFWGIKVNGVACVALKRKRPCALTFCNLSISKKIYFMRLHLISRLRAVVFTLPKKSCYVEVKFVRFSLEFEILIHSLSM